MSIWKEIVFAYNELVEVHYLSIPTWLALGAALQLLSEYWLPTRLSILIPLAYIIYCIIKTYFGSRQVFTGNFTNVKRGRWTGELPTSKGEEDDGVVCFVLSARMNHPLGPLAPGNDEVAKVFMGMWKEAAKNREKWGFLGNTATLHDTSDLEGTTMTWLSYWKNPKGLQEFSTSAAHRLGEINYNKKEYPFMGISHETFHAPKGCWESIYDNMPPWGIGKISDQMGTLVPKSPSVEHSSMFQRMRRNAAQ